MITPTQPGNNTGETMSTIYDGKLTAWLEIELGKLLTPILPPVGKLYEGVNSFEIETKNPKLIKLQEQLVALAREYERKQREDGFEHPVHATGEVHHGFDD